MVMSEAERFWSKVDKSGPVPDYAPHLGPCWVWTASLTTYGYGQFRTTDKRTVRSHRHAWLLTFGSLPADGLSLDHLCRVPRCVNPSHLDPVTHAENCRRGVAGQVNSARKRAQLYCAKGGHRLPDERNSQGRRVCKECARAKSLAYRQRQQERAA